MSKRLPQFHNDPWSQQEAVRDCWDIDGNVKIQSVARLLAATFDHVRTLETVVTDLHERLEAAERKINPRTS